MRWKQYSDDTELVYVPGEPEKSKIVDDFGSFKYWREPVPTLDLNSILQEVAQAGSSPADPEPAKAEVLFATNDQNISIN